MSSETEYFDVIVVGAGISGIGTGYHLQTMCPDRTFTILEGRDDLGGTWDLFRYPGIRSDSDMHTLGFSFKPWTDDKSIADGPSILEYLNETVDEFDLRRHIRFNHLVHKAEWSTEDAEWTVTVERGDGETAQLRCRFLSMCSGYYSYKEGYTPEFPGRDDFGGTIIHPQEWPEDLDYAGKDVVVIGSGATAVTLVPAMAEDAGHVTMLQRSPSYIVAFPDSDPLDRVLRKIFPDDLAYRMTRRKNVTMQQWMYRQTRVRPERVKKILLKLVKWQLPKGFDVEKHFTPTYDPWDQRMCLVPNGDLFKAIKAGDASVVTDHIDRFTADGIRLQSGEELKADIIVTATGLQLVTLGEVEFAVDGEPVDFSDTWTYRGMAYSDVPNLVATFGYINASWTLRADITAEYVCRLLNHMRAVGATMAVPRLRESDRGMEQRPWIDNFSSGYMQRAMHLFPKQGDRAPWVNTQRYHEDRALITESPVDDGVMRFSDPTGEAEAAEREDYAVAS